MELQCLFIIILLNVHKYCVSFISVLEINMLTHFFFNVGKNKEKLEKRNPTVYLINFQFQFYYAKTDFYQ